MMQWKRCVRKSSQHNGGTNTAAYAWRNWEKPRKPSVSIAGVVIEFQNTYIPSSSPEPCQYVTPSVSWSYCYNKNWAHFRVTVSVREPSCSCDKLPCYKGLWECWDTGQETVIVCTRQRWGHSGIDQKIPTICKRILQKDRLHTAIWQRQ